MPRKIDTAADRANLMLSLLSYLNPKRLGDESVTAGQLARHFDVELKEIERALRKLNVAGYKNLRDPSEYEANPYYVPFDMGDEDADEDVALAEDDIVDIVYNNDTTFFDAPNFSSEQASALITGLQYLRSLPDQSENAEILGLIDLLKEGRSSQSPIEIEYRPATKTATIEALQKAIKEQKRIRCTYRNQWQNETVREMDPIRIDPQSSSWMLRAWCHNHDELRSFRVDAISDAEVLDVGWVESAKTAQIGDAKNYIEQETDVEVVVEVDPEGYSLVGDFGGKAEKRSKANSKDGVIRATLKIGYLPYFGRAVAKFGGAVRVISPESAKAVVRDYALAAMGQIELDEDAE